jgi:hypothetical protein
LRDGLSILFYKGRKFNCFTKKKQEKKQEDWKHIPLSARWNFFIGSTDGSESRQALMWANCIAFDRNPFTCHNPRYWRVILNALAERFACDSGNAQMA